MITMVAHNLYIADMDGCKRTGDEAIIHACKHPCFTKMASAFHPQELVLQQHWLEGGNGLWLNMIDPDSLMFNLKIFQVSLEFISKNITQRKVVIHCNKAQSRSPSIAMLWLFNDKPYWEAKYLMSELYLYYQPSQGIDEYLEENWDQLKIIK